MKTAKTVQYFEQTCHYITLQIKVFYLFQISRSEKINKYWNTLTSVSSRTRLRSSFKTVELFVEISNWSQSKSHILSFRVSWSVGYITLPNNSFYPILHYSRSVNGQNHVSFVRESLLGFQLYHSVWPFYRILYFWEKFPPIK